MLTIDDVTVVDRAEALFASTLPTGSPVTTDEMHMAIADAMLARGGTAGCAAEMANTYGENPGFAAERMRWALGVLRRASAPADDPDRDAA